MWLLLLLIAPCLGLRTLEPPPPARSSQTNAKEGWVPVRLNHFRAFDTRTFNMRYFYNNEFSGHDIVIFVGGEWTISEGWTQAGLAYELAREMEAGLFYTEHRFYGNTRPFGDSSLPNLSLLSIDQALADLAQFIQHVKSDSFEYGRYRDAKVALVGCSYAGTIATWMRLAYPHLVDAAFSDSGPLHAQEDFPEYLEVVTEAIRKQGGEACLSSIEEGVEQLSALLETATGAEQVSEMFNTCTPLQANTRLDVATFFWYGITESFAYLVQYATPGKIPEACGILTNSAVASPVQRLANFVATSPLVKPCIETRYSQVVANHRNTDLDAQSTTMRLWTYQTCVEFGWYQSTTSDKQPFLKTVPVEYFHQMCKDFFSIYFDENRLRSGIERTNIFFGGLSHLPDNVVSFVGGHDPWSPMGPNATHEHFNAPVYVVPGIAHCRAITPTANSDTEQLKTVKTEVLEYMMHFTKKRPRPPIRPPRPPPNSATSAVASVVIILVTLQLM